MNTPAGALPELQTAYDNLSTYGRAHGITFHVADYGGVRTQADTANILSYRQADYNNDVARGVVSPDTTLQHYRPISAFGSSWHNYGAAFDVAIDARPAGVSDYDAKRQLGSMAPTVGLRWGGNFTNPDPPHFELAIPLSEAKARYAAMTGQPAAGVFDFVQSVATDYTADAGDEDAGGGSPFDDMGGAVSSSGLLVLGAVVVGVVVWAWQSSNHSRR